MDYFLGKILHGLLGYYLGKFDLSHCVNVNSAAHAYAHRRAGLARGAVMPRGGWLREVRRWACCGLRRTGGPSPGFGAFSSSPYTVPLCWAGGPGIAVLWSCQKGSFRCVTVSACFTYLLTY